MTITLLNYVLTFVILVFCFVNIQTWLALPQQKKYKIGLIALSIILFFLLGFVALVYSGLLHFNGAYAVSLGTLFCFLFILFTTFYLISYNDKYKKNLNIGAVVVVLILAAFIIISWYLKNIDNNGKLIF